MIGLFHLLLIVPCSALPAHIDMTYYDRTCCTTPECLMANGDKFNEKAFTAAHRSLPFGTLLLITYGGKQAIVEVTDRPHKRFSNRRLDVTKGVAEFFGFKKDGLVHPKVRVLDAR